MNARDWWEYYLNGKIIQRDDTPRSIISTMEDWLDGKRTAAMKAFIKGHPVSPRKLLAEIGNCLNENVQEREVNRLLALQVWAIRESQLAETAKALREAETAFQAAAQVAGLDDYHTYKIAMGPHG